jgi:hypothetical protein
MTDHMVEERIRKFIESTSAELSTEEVIHVAFCDECSRLVAAMFREYRETADIASKHI